MQTDRLRRLACHSSFRRRSLRVRSAGTLALAAEMYGDGSCRTPSSPPCAPCGRASKYTALKCMPVCCKTGTGRQAVDALAPVRGLGGLALDDLFVDDHILSAVENGEVLAHADALVASRCSVFDSCPRSAGVAFGIKTGSVKMLPRKWPSLACRSCSSTSTVSPARRPAANFSAPGHWHSASVRLCPSHCPRAQSAAAWARAQYAAAAHRRGAQVQHGGLAVHGCYVFDSY